MISEIFRFVFECVVVVVVVVVAVCLLSPRNSTPRLILTFRKVRNGSSTSKVFRDLMTGSRNQQVDEDDFYDPKKCQNRKNQL